MLMEPFLSDMLFSETPDEWVRLAKTKMRYEPMGVFATRLRLTPERFGRVKRAYIRTSRDHAVVAARQERMLADLPCDPVVTLESDHSSFFAEPETLVRHFLEIASALAAHQDPL